MAATENQLSKSAKIFLGGLFALAAVAVVPSLARLSMDTEGWLIFAIFGSAAAAAQLFGPDTQQHDEDPERQQRETAHPVPRR